MSTLRISGSLGGRENVPENVPTVVARKRGKYARILSCPPVESVFDDAKLRRGQFIRCSGKNETSRLRRRTLNSDYKALLLSTRFETTTAMKRSFDRR